MTQAGNISDLLFIKTADKQPLEKDKSLFLSLFETVTEPALIVTPQGEIIKFNDSYLEDAPNTAKSRKKRLFLSDIFKDKPKIQQLLHYGLTVNKPIPHSLIWKNGKEEQKVSVEAHAIRPNKKADAAFLIIKILKNPFTPINKFRNISNQLEEAKNQQYKLYKITKALGQKNLELETINTKLEIAGQKALDANQEKTRFLHSVTHELRTPLNAIIGFSQMLKLFGEQQDIDAKLLEYIDDIHNAGNHLLDLVNDILDIAKIENGKMEIHDEIIDPHPALERIAKMIQGQVMDKPIKIHTVYDNPDYKLKIDVKILKQLIINLVGNAIKFSKAEGGDVFIQTYPYLKGFVIEIEDTGIGMNSETLEQCIKPYEQVSELISNRMNGTGLGLSIVHGFMKRYKGDIEIKSQIGKGTAIKLIFPEKMTIKPRRRVKL